MTKIIDQDGNYQEYRISMLEEAERILSGKRTFVGGDRKNIERKILKIQGLIDFFYLEGEYEISQELTTLSKVLQVRKFLKI